MDTVVPSDCARDCNVLTESGRDERAVEALHRLEAALHSRGNGHRRRAHHSKDRRNPRLKDNLMQLALFAFIAAFLLISSIGILMFYRQTTLRRLSQVVSRAADASLLRSIAPTRGTKIEKLV